jgi:predicted anti-sigma-YlaC factor YlaD
MTHHQDDCVEAVHAVYRYLDGVVEQTEEIRITQHLRDCRGCADAIEFERTFLLRIRSACPEAPSEAFIERVRRLLREATDG